MKQYFFRKNQVLLWLLKITILVVIIVIIYGVYLNQKIKNCLDGNIWKLPAIVYGRVVSFKPDMLVSQKAVIKFLQASQYHQVKEVKNPGEFNQKNRKIEFIRRSFNFPDRKEGEIAIRLTFKNCYLKTIENMKNNHQFNFFRLDPPLITVLDSPNNKQRLFMNRNDFPECLVKMLLAIEDRRFYQHNGINFYSIGRALLVNLIARRVVQGASTLTQQLVKNLFFNNKRSYWRKMNEAYMALLINSRYSKDRILELYMNEVYLGQNGENEIRGFALASLYYFGRPIKELSLDQQALLVGMVKGASIYNPWKHPILALKRRNLVLQSLQHQNIIDKKLYNSLKVRALSIKSKNDIISSQPAFIQIVKQELQKKLGDKVKYLSGAKIFTTFDSVVQKSAEKATIKGISILKKQHKLNDLESAIVVVDRYSGEIRAIVGSAEPQYVGYNRAMQARRSIGSLAKPATYITALSQPNKYRLNTWIPDAPLSLYQPNGLVWAPKNENHRFSGHVMLIDALIRSINIPTVNLGMDLGLSSITDTWTKLGISKDRIHAVPSIILGSINLTPLEVAQTFQTIASGGNRVFLSSLCSIIAEDGTILFQNNPKAERVFPEQAAYMTLWAMQQVVQRGTGRHLGEQYPHLHLAGKTGTTNNSIDTWFVGIDGREVLIAWVGRDNNQSTKLYGSNGAMLIYQCYLINQSPTPLYLVPPKDVIDMNIDEKGNFICNRSLDKLPVWTQHPYRLCQTN